MCNKGMIFINKRRLEQRIEELLNKPYHDVATNVWLMAACSYLLHKDFQEHQIQHNILFTNKKQAYEWLHISYQTFTAWEKAGLPSHHIDNQVIYLKEEMLNWLKHKQ